MALEYEGTNRKGRLLNHGERHRRLDLSRAFVASPTGDSTEIRTKIWPYPPLSLQNLFSKTEPMYAVNAPYLPGDVKKKAAQAGLPQILAKVREKKGDRLLPRCPLGGHRNGAREKSHSAQPSKVKRKQDQARHNAGMFVRGPRKHSVPRKRMHDISAALRGENKSHAVGKQGKSESLTYLKWRARRCPGRILKA